MRPTHSRRFSLPRRVHLELSKPGGHSVTFPCSLRALLPGERLLEISFRHESLRARVCLDTVAGMASAPGPERDPGDGHDHALAQTGLFRPDVAEPLKIGVAVGWLQPHVFPG